MAPYLQPKQRIGGYEIEALVGRGGMGEVYRARQLSMDRVVALKVLSTKLSRSDPSFAKKFVDEARAAGRLNHPNIVAVHDVGKATMALPGGGEEEAYYFSMEYVDGETLKPIIQREGACPPELIARVLSSMADALLYAEAMGVVHRDIKPDNIMVTARGEVKLADLGLAQQMGEIDRFDERDANGRGRVMGTPLYMSPEQARGLQTDHRSDQYSLGATLFHMLTGRQPFVGDSSKAIMRAHVFDAVPDPRELVPEVSEPWRRLCLRLMAKDPAQRFPDAAQLRQAVQAAIAARPATPAPVPSRRLRSQASRPIAPWRRRQTTVPGWVRRTLGLAALVALGLAGALIAYLNGQRGNVDTAPGALVGADAATRARGACAALPADPALAVAALDELIARAAPADAEYRAALAVERERLRQRLDDDRRARRDERVAQLAQAEQDVDAGHLARARAALDAFADDDDAEVAARGGALRARLDEALRERSTEFVARIAGAADAHALEVTLAEAQDAGIDAAALRDAADHRRAELAAVPARPATAPAPALAPAPARPLQPPAAADPDHAIWRAAFVALDQLRGAVPARYDDIGDVARQLIARPDASPTVVAHLQLLATMPALLDKADSCLRNQVMREKPQVAIRVGDRQQLMRVEDLDRQNVYVTVNSIAASGGETIAGRQPRNRALAVGLERQLRASLDNHPFDQRRADNRVRLAWLWYWRPDLVGDALKDKDLVDDPLAKALAALQHNGRLLDVVAPVTAQGTGAVVTYDFSGKDRALLADFEGDGASFGERGLRWRTAQPLAAPVESALPTLSWRGRLQPPLTITARVLPRTDSNLVLLGVLAAGSGPRVGLSQADLRQVAVDVYVPGGDGRLQHLDHGAGRSDVAMTGGAAVVLEISIDANRRATFSAGGHPLAQGAAVPVGDGPLTIALQGFEPPNATMHQSEIEIVSLTIAGTVPQ